MGRYKVQLEAAAESDVWEITRYIAQDLKEPGTADKLSDRIYAEIFSLDTMPECYPLVRDRTLARDGYRITSVGKYLIIYTINHSDRTVHIQRVFYGRQNWAAVLKNPH